VYPDRDLLSLSPSHHRDETIMPSIVPTMPLTPEDETEPFDEDPTGDPDIPGEVPSPSTDDEVRPLPSNPDADPSA